MYSIVQFYVFVFLSNGGALLIYVKEDLQDIFVVVVFVFVDRIEDAFLYVIFYFIDQLYFAILNQKLRSTPDRHCFCIDEELAYEKYVQLFYFSETIPCDAKRFN